MEVDERPPINRIERRVNDRVPGSSMGVRGAHAETWITSVKYNFPWDKHDDHRSMVCVVGAAALASCGTMRSYDGPQKAPGEIATLVVIHPEFTIGKVFISNVDHSYDLRDVSMRKSIELLPGHHVIAVGHANSSVSCALTFEA